MDLISEGTKTASKTIKNISNILTNRISERKKISKNILNYKNRRYENDVIIKKQNELFAVTSIKTSGGSKRLALSQVGGSFLSRILQFAGFVTSGWLLTNMPTWIAGAKELSNRITSLNSTFSGFVNNIWNMIYDIGRVSTALFENLKTFDLTDSSDRIRNSLIELTGTLDIMGEQIKEAFSVLTEPFMNVPPLGTEAGPGAYPDLEPQRPEQPTQPQQPSGGTGGEFSGSGVSKGAQIARRLQKDLGLTDYQAAAVVGNLLNESSQLNPAQIQNGGSGLLKVDGKTGYGWAQWTFPTRQRELYQLAQSMGVDPSRQPLTDEINYAMLVRELPRYDKNGRFRSSRNIQEASNWLLTQYFRPANKGPREQRERIEAGQQVLKSVKSTSSSQQSQSPSQKPQPPSQKSTPTPTSTPTRAISTGNMNLIPHTGSGGFIQGGSGSKGENQYATHFHIDAKRSNPSDAELKKIREVSYQAVKVMQSRGSKVYFGNINQYASKNDSELIQQIIREQKAHDLRSSAAIDIQEINPNVKRTIQSQPGSRTKFPFAVGPVYMRGGYGREAEIIGSGGITVSHGASGSTSSQISSSTPTPSTPLIPSSNSSVSQIPSEIEMQSTTTEGDLLQSILNNIKESSKRQDIILIDDLQDTSTQSTGNFVISDGISLDSQLNEKELLYSFLKNKLLLDLNYL
jgi:hypothetical protein